MQCHPLQGFRSGNMHLVAMASRLMAWPPPTGIEPSPLPVGRNWTVAGGCTLHGHSTIKRS